MATAFESVWSIEGAFKTCRMVRIRTGHLALLLGELSPEVTERALAVTVYPLRLRSAQTPLPTGETRGAEAFISPSLPAKALLPERHRALRGRAGLMWRGRMRRSPLIKDIVG